MTAASCISDFAHAGSNEPKVLDVLTPSVLIAQNVPIHYYARNAGNSDAKKGAEMEPNSPLTFKSAVVICVGCLLTAGTVMWAAYTQVQGQISESRNEISALRTVTHDDFNRVSDKLDDINKTLSSIQVDLATQKIKYEKAQQ